MSSIAIPSSDLLPQTASLPQPDLRLVNPSAEFQALTSQATTLYTRIIQQGYLGDLRYSRPMQTILRCACFIETARLGYQSHLDGILIDAFEQIFNAQPSSPVAVKSLLASSLAGTILRQSQRQFEQESTAPGQDHMASQLQRGLGASILLLACHATIGAPNRQKCNDWAMQFIYAGLDQPNPDGHRKQGDDLLKIAAEQNHANTRRLIDPNPEKRCFNPDHFRALSDLDIGCVGQAAMQCLNPGEIHAVLECCRNQYPYTQDRISSTVLFELHRHGKDRLLAVASRDMAKMPVAPGGARVWAALVAEIGDRYSLR